MNIEKALDRFKFRLTSQWKHNEIDLDAFNTIIRFVNVQEDELLNKNQLFGKLYIYFFN